MNSTEKRKFRISRWIFIGLSVLMNSFVIVYSCLPEDVTVTWNNFVTNLFTKMVNNMTSREVKTIPLTNIQIGFSNEQTYKYNYLPGYEVYEIPLGSAKQISYSYAPVDATDTAIEYYAEDTSLVSLNQSGGDVSVVGMKVGSTIIHGKNKMSGLESTCEVRVVETVEPQSYEISVASSEIRIGEQQTILFDIDGGNLGHNELINFRYYDTRKLSFSSSNESILTINEYGVVRPVAIGNAVITISSHKGFSKSLDMTVLPGIAPTPYSDLKITGPNIAYENDMIKDQSTHENHQQLEIYDGDLKLNPEDFVWHSSDELLVKVDSHGVMRGFRKKINQDESAIITATSKTTKQSTVFNVVVKEYIPQTIDFSIELGDKLMWHPNEYTGCIGDTLIFKAYFKPDIIQKDLVVEYNDDLVDFTNQGSAFSLVLTNEGNCSIKATSVANPSLSFVVDLTIVKAGAISTDNMEDVGLSLRKIIGHASLFAIAEVFTIIAVYMFIYDKKQWLPIAISLGIELTLSALSEIIQSFESSRHGSIIDVMINFAGVVIGAGIMVAVYFVHKVIKKKKARPKEIKDK